MIIPCITRLLVCGGPATIAWGIISICVNPINGSPRKPSIFHVSKESAKTVPFTTDFNPPSAIVFPTRVFRLRAAISHSTPCLIYSGFPFSGSMTVNSFCGCRPKPLVATARLGMATSKLKPFHDCLIATFARAFKEVFRANHNSAQHYLLNARQLIHSKLSELASYHFNPHKFSKQFGYWSGRCQP